MNRRELLALGLSTAALPRMLRSAPQGPAPDAWPKIRELIQTRMAQLNIPGVAVGMVKNGVPVTAGFGLTNLNNPQPVTPDTVFPIASISKTVAATAVMRLVETGRLDLRAPVVRYLPAFRVLDERVSREVTMWHLLTHTPGWEGQLPIDDRGTLTLENFVVGLKSLPQLAEPGSVWSYNNAGFGVAGRVIEAVTGRGIHEACRELVFEPLGLTHAYTRTGDLVTRRFAVPHRQSSTGVTEVIRPFDLPPNVTAGGAAMSVESLLSYARFHLNDGAHGKGAAVLQTATIEQMRTPQLRKNATDDEMGIGWQLRRVGGVMTAAHGGTLGGHCLHIQLVPERRLAFAILTNHTDGWRLIQEIERTILREYEGLALAPGQRVGHRGVNEAMTGHSSALPTQPALAPYVGTYRRPPLGEVVVSASPNGLVVKGTGGAGPAEAAMTFYGPDVAYATSGSFTGSPFEFIRSPSGDVGWLRINGRIARKS